MRGLSGQIRCLVFLVLVKSWCTCHWRVLIITVHYTIIAFIIRIYKSYLSIVFIIVIVIRASGHYIVVSTADSSKPVKIILSNNTHVHTYREPCICKNDAYKRIASISAGIKKLIIATFNYVFIFRTLCRATSPLPRKELRRFSVTLPPSSIASWLLMNFHLFSPYLLISALPSPRLTLSHPFPTSRPLFLHAMRRPPFLPSSIFRLPPPPWLIHRRRNSFLRSCKRMESVYTYAPGSFRRLRLKTRCLAGRRWNTCLQDGRVLIKV